MRRFNPEKELRKIQKGNKNKVIYGVIALLLIIAIGSSYALYQIRYNKRIIYTTVAPFTKKDIIISVKLDDQDKSVDTFPGKEEGYVYSHTECENENIKNASWSDLDWNLTASINGPDKCTVYFVKSPFHMKSCEGKEMSECLLNEGQKFTKYLAFDDPDQNGRYIGADPANYIWFNCDDYSNPSESTCERWRIIGSFNNIEKVNEDGSTTEQNLVKIIRSEKIGNFVWDNKKLPDEYSSSDSYPIEPNGYNNWVDATLMKMLNPGYEDNKNPNSDTLANNSLYWNRSKGQCAAPGSNQLKEYDFRGNGLKNGTTKDIIENVVWHLGGLSSDKLNTKETYEEERGEEVYGENAVTWQGKIGLYYPSDYGYSTDGGELERNFCLETQFNEWVNNSACYQNSYLNNSGASWQWSITHHRTHITAIANHAFNGGLGRSCSGRYEFAIRPVLYLTYDTKVIGGDGTYSSPYIISVN